MTDKMLAWNAGIIVLAAAGLAFIVVLLYEVIAGPPRRVRELERFLREQDHTIACLRAQIAVLVQIMRENGFDIVWTNEVLRGGYGYGRVVVMEPLPPQEQWREEQ